MKSLDKVRPLLVDFLKASANKSDWEIKRLITTRGQGFLWKVYGAFFELIVNPNKNPECITDLLDTFTSGLHGFSTNKHIQTVIAFACFEGLAQRRPGVIEGPWETLVWRIVWYSSFANTEIGNELINFKEDTNRETLMYIIKLGSPEVCPNPCLRLELFRFMRSLNCRDLYTGYSDRESYRDMVINTLFELSDNYTSLTVDQVPNFSPIDLEFIMVDNSINIGYIVTDSELELKTSKIIVAVSKLTRNFAYLQKEKQQISYNQRRLYENWGVGLDKQMAACSSFCGLLEWDYKFDQNALFDFFVHAVANDSILLHYVIETLDTIKQITLCDPDDREINFTVSYRRDKILNTLFKGYITKIPTFQFNKEINGGITPAVEYRIRYFQNNLRDQEIDNDSDNDSEYFDSGEDSVSEDFF